VRFLVSDHNFQTQGAAAQLTKHERSQRSFEFAMVMFRCRGRLFYQFVNGTFSALQQCGVLCGVQGQCVRVCPNESNKDTNLMSQFLIYSTTADDR